MKIIKTYRADFIGNIKRKQTEKKLFEKGFKVIQEEEIKQRIYSGCAILFFFVIFFPLALIALIKTKFIMVTYED